MPEMKMFTWVALAAMAPGMASPISALISGVRRGQAHDDPRAGPLARPTRPAPPGSTPADQYAPGGGVGGADRVRLRQDGDQHHEVQQHRRAGREDEAPARVQHAREQGHDGHAGQVGHADLGQHHRQLELGRVVGVARVDHVHQPRHGQLGDDGDDHGGRGQGGHGVGGQPVGRRPRRRSPACANRPARRPRRRRPRRRSAGTGWGRPARCCRRPPPAVALAPIR